MQVLPGSNRHEATERANARKGRVHIRPAAEFSFDIPVITWKRQLDPYTNINPEEPNRLALSQNGYGGQTKESYSYVFFLKITETYNYVIRAKHTSAQLHRCKKDKGHSRNNGKRTEPDHATWGLSVHVSDCGLPPRRVLQMRPLRFFGLGRRSESQKT